MIINYDHTDYAVIDEYTEWFQRQWSALLKAYFSSRPKMTFDAFCAGAFMERRELVWLGWEGRPS